MASKCKYIFKGVTYSEDEFREFLKTNSDIHAPDYKVSEFSDFSDTHQKTYVNQITAMEETFGDVPVVLKQTVERLMKSSALVKLNSQTNKYVNLQNPSKSYERVGDFVKGLTFKDVDGYFAFKSGEENTYEDNRQWGNQIDDVLVAALRGDTQEEAVAYWIEGVDKRKDKNVNGAIVDKEVIESIYTQFKTFIDSHKDQILVPQVTFFNEKEGVAGTADIVAVDKNGKIKIFDLKSGKDSTQDSKYTRTYGKEGASKKERHSAQLSAYKGMAQAQDFIFQDFNELEILPVHISEVDNNLVKAVEFEPLISLSAYSDIVNKFNENPNHLTLDTKMHLANVAGKMRIILEQQRMALERKTNIKDKYWKLKANEKLQREILQVESFKAMENFINSVYSTLVESRWVNKKTGQISVKQGIAAELEYILTSIENNDLEAFEAIDELVYYKNLVESYEGTINDIQGFYQSQGLDTVKAEKDTPLWKINQIVETGRVIKRKYDREILPIIADILAKQSSDESTDKAKKELEIKDRIITEARRRGESPKYLKRLEEERDKLKKYSPEQLKKNILTQLKYGSFEDIGTADTWLSPAISSSNAVLANFAKAVKKEFEDGRLESFDFTFEAVKALDNFKDASGFNVEEFNKDFYESVYISDSKTVLKFVQRLDEDAYNRAKKTFGASIKDLENTDEEAWRAKWKEWYEINNMPLPEEDYVINGVTILKGKNSMKFEQKQLLNRNLINKTEYANEIKSIDKLNIPNYNKYPNKKFAQLTGKKKEYYNFLVSSYFKAQERTPDGSRIGFQLPSVPKKGLDRLLENGITDYVKYSWGQSSKLEEDRDQYGEVTESGLKVVPLLYHNNLKPEDTSVDLLSSIVLYNDATLKYQSQMKLSSFSEATLDIVQRNTPIKTNSLGSKYLDKAANNLGIMDEYLKYRHKNFNDNNLATLLGIFIDMQIYGKTNIPHLSKIAGKERDLGKLSNGLMNFASLTQLAVNPIVSVVNYLDGNIQNRIDASSKEFFSDSELTRAKHIYDKEFAKGTFIQDFTNPISKSFIGQFVDIYDGLQGEYRDKLGRKISNSTAKKMWSSDTLFFTQHLSNHKVQVETLLAYAHRIKVKVNGEMKPLYEAYELDSKGKIKLKAGVVLPGIVSKNGLISYDVQNTVHAISKRLQGVYNSFDKIAVERYWLGRLFTMYKKFLVPGIKKRYKGLTYDYELGGYTEGFYTTFYRKLMSDWSDTLKMFLPTIIGGTSDKFTPLEQANLKRATREITIIAMTGAICMALTALIQGSDDDDEKLALRYFLYLSLKTNADLGVFLGPGDPQNLFIPNVRELARYPQNPFAVYGIIKKGQKVMDRVLSPTKWDETYKRDTGIWKKGDLKLEADFLKFWGLQGSNFDPEQGVKWLQMQTQ